jgi:hypothetical protein
MGVRSIGASDSHVLGFGSYIGHLRYFVSVNKISDNLCDEIKQDLAQWPDNMLDGCGNHNSGVDN